MNGEQRNQSLQNGSYKMVVEDGKVTVTPEQSQQQSEEEKALIQRLREKIGTKVNDLSLLYTLDEANIGYEDMDMNKKQLKTFKTLWNISNALNLSATTVIISAVKQRKKQKN